MKRGDKVRTRDNRVGRVQDIQLIRKGCTIMRSVHVHFDDRPHDRWFPISELFETTEVVRVRITDCSFRSIEHVLVVDHEAGYISLTVGDRDELTGIASEVSKEIVGLWHKHVNG